MNQVDLLINNNYNANIEKTIAKRLKLSNKRLYYKLTPHNGNITGENVIELITLFSYVRKKYRQNIPLTVIIQDVEFYDKLVYILIENIVHTIIVFYKYDFDVACLNIHNSIYTEGIKYTSLSYLKNLEKYKQSYRKDINLNHYRRIITNTELHERQRLSDLMQEINSFFRNNIIEEKVSNQLAEVIAELVGNAYEHGKTDCMVDIDITDSKYIYPEMPDESYYGINVVVLNYSNVLLYQPLMNRINKADDLPERYSIIKKAYDKHKTYFCGTYDEQDFFTISSFQHRISGNPEKEEMGGTGLTSLLNSLEEQSETHLCYVLSGNRILFFEKEFMKYDSDGFIGFNKDNVYTSERPEEDLLQRINTYFPGVSYNLNYSIKKV